MKIYVNDTPVEIPPGMTVKHALISAGLFNDSDSIKSVRDKWGNEIGLDGELMEGERIYVVQKKN
jgi:sulfur carrier protein ThiS